MRKSDIDTAAKTLNSYWPLRNFIACNAVAGLEEMSFDQAMSFLSANLKASVYLPLSDYRAYYENGRINPRDFKEALQSAGREARRKVDTGMPATWSELLDAACGARVEALVGRQVIKWLGSFFDDVQAQSEVDKSGGLWCYWRRHVGFDLSLSIHGSRGWRARLEALSENSYKAITQLLEATGVDEDRRIGYAGRHFLRLPGWSSHLKWRQANGHPDVLADFLALVLFYEFEFATAYIKRQGLPDAGWKSLIDRAGGAVDPDGDYAYEWQEAYELNYRNKLLALIDRRPSRIRTERPDCQMVFCIDCRSEPVRRLLESSGSYETVGFAGFFGFPMKFKPLCGSLETDLCPVLISPDKLVTEAASRGRERLHLSFRSLAVSAQQLRKRLKSSLAGAFGMVEAIGMWSSMPLILRTFLPGAWSRLESGVKRGLTGDQERDLDLTAFSLDEMAALAEGCLRGMSLTDCFAPLVVFCGHGSSSVNNPFASSLDCGACGGNAGGINARFAATVMNRPDVRSMLAERGIRIPDDTLFVAALHNTTTDRFEILDRHLIPLKCMEMVERLSDDLISVSKAAREAKRKRLPDGGENLDQRAVDWAQVLPEWGLARNAAFVAAPRDCTAGADLDGRVFLHSYDWEKDSSVAVLETIMTAPLVVAQWINMQYYLSTVDNNVFGSGSKTVHNVVGDFGVMTGQFGDLRLGLPMESVMSSESVREHEPMRLLAVIRAPRRALDSVMVKHRNIGNLVSNRWIRLVAIEPQSGEMFESKGEGAWLPIELDPAEKAPGRRRLPAFARL